MYDLINLKLFKPYAWYIELCVESEIYVKLSKNFKNSWIYLMHIREILWIICHWYNYIFELKFDNFFGIITKNIYILLFHLHP